MLLLHPRVPLLPRPVRLPPRALLLLPAVLTSAETAAAIAHRFVFLIMESPRRECGGERSESVHPKACHGSDGIGTRDSAARRGVAVSQRVTLAQGYSMGPALDG